MKKDKIEVFVLLLVGIIAAGVVFLALMKYILPCILPFIISFAAALATKAPAARISKKTHISERFLRPTLAVFGTLAVALGLSLLLFGLGNFLFGLVSDIAAGGRLYAIALSLTEPPLPIFRGLPEGIAEGLLNCIWNILESLGASLAKIITNAARAIPDMLISVVITFISIIYFSIDIDRICGFIKSRLPEKYRGKLSEFKVKIFGILGKYVKSYLQIMGITFVIMLIGLLILRVKDALLLSLVIALFDLLPVLGVGGILLPWSALSFMLGNTPLGVGLIILFVLYTVMREALEPKIFGRSLDTHPVVTLISLYVGYALFGFFGMVVFPVAAVLISGLFKKNESAEVG